MGTRGARPGRGGHVRHPGSRSGSCLKRPRVGPCLRTGALLLSITQYHTRYLRLYPPSPQDPRGSKASIVSLRTCHVRVPHHVPSPRCRPLVFPPPPTHTHAGTQARSRRSTTTRTPSQWVELLLRHVELFSTIYFSNFFPHPHPHTPPHTGPPRQQGVHRVGACLHRCARRADGGRGGGGKRVSGNRGNACSKGTVSIRPLHGAPGIQPATLHLRAQGSNRQRATLVHACSAVQGALPWRYPNITFPPVPSAYLPLPPPFCPPAAPAAPPRGCR